jgi:flagellar hook protein FlgE
VATNNGDAVTFTKALTVTLTGIVGNDVTFTPATTTATLAGATISSNAGSPNWNTYLAIDGVLVPPVGTALTQLSFDTLGQLASTTPVTTPVGTMSSAAFTPTGAAAQTVSFDFASTSQYGGAFGVNSLTQDGFSSGRLSGFNTSSDGTILGRYSNGQSRALGQVLLANFTNPQGLQPMGNNVWVESATSGGPLVGTPGSSALGILQSSAVEDSNVDLTAELVNMITAQRVYQANAQTIKAQDQVLQTLVNLR